MTKTSSAVAQACSKVEISADGVTWTDIGSEATTVTFPKEVVTVGSVPVFYDDYHVVTSGKIAPITVTVSGVYTEEALEAFEQVLDAWEIAGCGKRLDLRVTPRGGGVGQREITISPGKLVGLKPPDLSAADGGPALFEFDIFGNYTYAIATS